MLFKSCSLWLCFPQRASLSLLLLYLSIYLSISLYLYIQYILYLYVIYVITMAKVTLFFLFCQSRIAAVCFFLCVSVNSRATSSVPLFISWRTTQCTNHLLCWGDHFKSSHTFDILCLLLEAFTLRTCLTNSRFIWMVWMLVWKLWWTAAPQQNRLEWEFFDSFVLAACCLYTLDTF